MHPALSVIVFTVSSGLGYGLAVMLGLGLLDPATLAGKTAHVVALVLIAGGLLSSTLHLGNPRRAWRAFSQWRSSWLSREGVAAVATFVPLTIAAGTSLFMGKHVPVVGLIGAVMALTTVYCTAMIYASLRSIQAWATPLTPASYMLLSLAGGAVLATCFAAAGGGHARGIAAAAIPLLIAAWVAKLAWRNRMLTMRPISTPETATGLGFIGKVGLFESPHTNDSYLTREMGYRIARKHAAKLAAISLGLGGVVPVLAMGVVLASEPGILGLCAAIAGFLGFVTGVFVERWLFFAEARHAVANYYGR